MSDASSIDAVEILCRMAASPALLDDVSARQVRQLLETQVASPKPASRRMGLLVGACLLEGDSYVTEEIYEAHRARATGETWPDATTLARSFGYWARAVYFASRYARYGPSKGSWNGDAREPRKRRYIPAEVIDALIDAKDSLGHWPIASEYDLWRKVRMNSARATGKPAPRLPNQSPIRKLFGSYKDAITAAQGIEARDR